MKLELGCGLHPTTGYQHHDRYQHSPWVQYAHDLNVVPWPWKDGSVSDLLALDVFEHLDLPVERWLAECWRLLRPATDKSLGGLLTLRVPAHDNPVSWRDPTHRRVFTHDTFEFFCPGMHWWQHYGRIYFPDGPWFQQVSVKRVNPDHRWPDLGDWQVVLRRIERPAT